MSKPLKTVIIGFGKISSGYALDPSASAALKYATHAQALVDHPEFSLAAVVDPSPEARSWALDHWKIADAVESLEKLPLPETFDVAVIASPPDKRQGLLEKLPNLKGVMLEKPIAMDLQEAVQFVSLLRARSVCCQVNLLRRGDQLTRQLASGRLAEEIGAVQCVFGVYGNGLKNNGTHMVDLVRMLFAEVETAVPSLSSKQNWFYEGPIPNDKNFGFDLLLKSGLQVNFQPLKFSCFRENGLDIWGEKGRIQYLHGGLTILKSKIGLNRMSSQEREIVCDQIEKIDSTLGFAIYNLYTNLADAINGGAKLLSPIQSALETQRLVESLQKAHG